MAKDQPTTELVVNDPEILTHIEVDKDDVLAIGITEAEEYMQAELARCQDTAKDLQKEATEHEQQRCKILAAAGKEFADGIEEELTAGLQCLKPKKLHFSNEVGCLIRPREGTRKQVQFNVTIRVSEEGHGGLSLTRTFTEKAPKEAVTEDDEAQRCREEAQAASNEALEWKRRLTRIPQYERKLRAELAKSRLSKSQAGKDVLHAMLGDVTTRVLALPGK